MSKRIIGPFLGPRGISGMSINIGLPDHTIDELTCKLICSDQSEKEVPAKPKHNCFRLFQFEIENLNPQETYKYQFSYRDKNGELKELDLGNGLTYEDCKFKVLGNHKESSFVVLSCNNPFETEDGSADNGWAMWEELEAFLEKDHSVRLIVLGGDQVYNDDIEEEFLSKDKKTKKNSTHAIQRDLSDDKIKKQLKNRFISQYHKYWKHKSYRKIFASVPSVAIWDDHDITDGWGSRPESFNKKSESETGFKDNWWHYFLTAREAFKAYQFSRNDKKIDNTPENVSSSYLDWEENRFVLCDFRSERNSQKHILWSEKHKRAVLNFIKTSPERIKRIFFLTPVVPLRTNLKQDKRVGKVAKALFDFKKHIEKNPKYLSKSRLWYFLPFILFLFPVGIAFFSKGIEPFAHIIFTILLYIVGLLSILWISVPKLIINKKTQLKTNPDKDKKKECYKFCLVKRIWNWGFLPILFLLPIFILLFLEYSFPHLKIYTFIHHIIFAICFYTIGLLSIVWIGISKLIIKETPHLPELSDDIEDGLSSKTNIKSLKEILDTLIKVIKENNKEVFILSGDIHLGGLTEIIDTRDGPKASILQIVSSPIAHKPMPKVVEGLTTTTSEMVLREYTDDKKLFFRNIFYISKRNFVQIIPHKINEGKGIRFFLEKHQLPLIFPKKFS